MARLACQSCGAPVAYDEPIPRDSQCESCGTDLRCCRNCRHWDPHYSNECTETQADLVTDKTRRNFCEFFYYSRAAFTGKPGGVARDRAAEARAKLDALFGGPKSGGEPTVPGDSPPAPADTDAARKAKARAALEGLFKQGDGTGEGEAS